MQKNKFIRLATIFVILLFASTCVLSATYAKYTTSTSGADSATVAKWNILLSAEGTLFSEQYLALEPTIDSTADGISVQYMDFATDNKNILAPGTQNSNGMTFTISGTAEVKLELTISVEATDIALNKDINYEDYSTGEEADVFILTEDYHPVKFTLTKDNNEIVLDSGTKTLNNVTLAEIEAYLESLSEANVEANTPLPMVGIYQLTWSWDIDGNNKADTYLAHNPQDISFKITMSAIQLD